MGVTASEEILSRLARRTFLTPWSYANPYRNQKQHGKGTGKELCDFLVVFGRDILIFSDKHIQFPDSGKVDIDWQRWYRRAVLDSIRQIMGAERWIRNYPEEIFADPGCSEMLRVCWPVNPRIHRLVIVRGASERAKRELGEASLFVTNEVFGPNAKPFFLCQPGADFFYHIIDESALDILLDYLDTAPDLIEYLDAKETLFRSKANVLAFSEQDLLGWYITSLDASEKHCFPVPSDAGERDQILVDGGHWQEFLTGPQHAAWQ